MKILYCLIDLTLILIILIISSCYQLPPLTKEKLRKSLVEMKNNSIGTVITIKDKDLINVVIQNSIGNNKLLNQIIIKNTPKIDIVLYSVIDTIKFEVSLKSGDKIILYHIDEYDRMVGFESIIKGESQEILDAQLGFINLILKRILNENAKSTKKEKIIVKKEKIRKDYALLFATDEYDNWNNLNNPIFDAKGIKKELIRLYNFDVELVENATLQQINIKLTEYAKKEYNEDDQLLIFFAGHGDYNIDRYEGYVVAKDSKFKDEYGFSYYPWNRLLANIDIIPCKHILLTTDVCFGGTLDEFIARQTQGTDIYKRVGTKEFINRCLQSKTRKYLASAKKDYVSDGIPKNHSPFAYYFIETLKTGGGADRVLDFNEIIKNIAKLEQEPAWESLKNDEPGSNFIFIAK